MKYQLRVWWVDYGSEIEVEADTPQEAIKQIESGPDRWMVTCDELYCAELHTDDSIVAELRQCQRADDAN